MCIYVPTRIRLEIPHKFNIIMLPAIILGKVRLLQYNYSPCFSWKIHISASSGATRTLWKCGNVGGVEQVWFGVGYVFTYASATVYVEQHCKFNLIMMCLLSLRHVINLILSPPSRGRCSEATSPTTAMIRSAKFPRNSAKTLLILIWAHYNFANHPSSHWSGIQISPFFGKGKFNLR